MTETNQALEMAAREDRAWKLLCKRLQRASWEAEEDDTCSLRAAWKAMLAFAVSENIRALTVPPGWLLVPEEATEEMVDAGALAAMDYDEDGVWSAMLSAAPTPPSSAEGQDHE